MKKSIKLSLVAIAAVSCVNVANAKPLTEAIQDVDVSGSVLYRYDDYKDAFGHYNSYKVGLNLSAKATDDIKVNTRFLGTNDPYGNYDVLTTGTADKNIGVNLANVYFSYTGIKNTTVNVGKQGIATPWSVPAQLDGNEQTGTGITALTTWGPATFVGAWFNQTNVDQEVNAFLGGTVLDGASDLYAVGAIGNFGFVSVDAWYASLEETANGYGADTWTVGAKGSYDFTDSFKMGFNTRYTELEAKKDSTKVDNSAFRFDLTSNISIVNLGITYAATGKDGGLVAFDEYEAQTAWTGWHFWLNDAKDADVLSAIAGVQVHDAVNVAVIYAQMDHKGGVQRTETTKIEEDEVYLQVVYNISNNLSSYVIFGQYNRDVGGVEAKDGTSGRLQIAYTF